MVARALAGIGGVTIGLAFSPRAVAEDVVLLLLVAIAVARFLATAHATLRALVMLAEAVADRLESAVRRRPDGYDARA